MTMTPTLRDALAAARINRMKARAAKAWHRTQCQNCRGAYEQAVRPLVDLLRGEFLPDDDAPPPADKSRH
jgi:hypothetical protein